jgi:hypothetical protein
MILSACLAVSCGDDDGESVGSPSTTPGTNPDVAAGATTFVAVLNPIVNTGHTTGTPGSLGTGRDGVTVAIRGGASITTADGLGVLPAPVGPITVDVGAAAIGHTVVAEGDVYDAPIAVSGTTAAYFDATPIRYAVGKGSGAVFFAPTDNIGTIETKLGDDDVVVVLRPGIYKGNLRITGKGALLFGEGFKDRAVTIEGSISAEGEEVRLRGLTITGNLESKGNNFGISFSVVRGATTISGNGGAFVRNVFCGQTKVPSSNATLLDNYGVEPIKAPPAGVCQ